jgi:hypothetical protein
MNANKWLGLCVAGSIAIAMSGCIVESSSSPPPPTRIRFEETTNLGYYCGGPLSSWQVSCRETEEQGTAGCEQPVDFDDLQPYTAYTFDITGWSGGTACWQGSCSVTTGPRGSTTYADCSALVVQSCKF